MIARIELQSQHLPTTQYNELQTFLGETVKTSLLCYDEGKRESFYNWSMTFDPEEADKEPGEGERKKKLVKACDDYIGISNNGAYVADLELLMNRFPSLKFVVNSRLESSIHVTDSNIEGLRNLVTNLDVTLRSFNRDIEYNSRCEVHVPGIGLLLMNRTAYATDMCTEALQDMLNEGWRILAVCPQPDQRRPDYVLGRYRPDPPVEVSSTHAKSERR